jgi:hypothetical protein
MGRNKAEEDHRQQKKSSKELALEIKESSTIY